MGDAEQGETLGIDQEGFLRGPLNTFNSLKYWITNTARDALAGTFIDDEESFSVRIPEKFELDGELVDPGRVRLYIKEVGEELSVHKTKVAAIGVVSVAALTAVIATTRIVRSRTKTD